MSGRVVHLRKDKYDVRIDRATKWGNPYTHRKDVYEKRANGMVLVPTRHDAVESYRQLLWDRIKRGIVTLEELAALDGKVLGCWCAPQECHGDVLVRAASWAAGELKKKG